MNSTLQRLWYGEPSGLGRLLGKTLVPLSWAYRAGLAVNRITARAQALDCPVISVGNLTVGGNGKTPLVVELASRLQEAGKKVAVLSRGYGRKSSGLLVVQRPGEVPRPALDAGDEPVLIARRCPLAAVVVGENRVEAGRLAVREFSPDVILCDDAFQHRQLIRDLDILAVHAVRGFGNGRLLPGGPLREPRQALQRADLVVFTHAGRQSTESLRSLHRLDQSLKTGALALEPDGFIGHLDHAKTGLAAQTPVVAACAIANPEGFYESCRAAGLRLVGTRAFPDHHRFSGRDLKQLEQLCTSRGAAALVVTEKDLVRLGVVDLGVRLLALRISGHWTDEASRVTMENLLAEKVGLYRKGRSWKTTAPRVSG